MGYAKMAAWHAFVWLGALYLSLGGASCAARMAGAAAMGVFWQQLAGIGHDLGHSGVTHSFYKDHAIGSLLSAFMGLSVGWWKSDHNTHHVVCNAIEHDPNVQHMPMLAITSKIFARARFWDTYHRKWVGMDDVAHALVSYQHLFFYPLMLVGRWNLYVQGLLYLITQHDTTHFRKTELTGVALYFAWVLGVALSMPTWVEAVSWVMVSHARRRRPPRADRAVALVDALVRRPRVHGRRRRVVHHDDAHDDERRDAAAGDWRARRRGSSR